MRNIDMLKDIKDAFRLQQWLYADENNRITVKNAVGAELTLSMDEEGEVMARFEDADQTVPYDGMLSVPIWLGIIEQLREQPPERKHTEFKSRWDEIKFDMAIVATLNKI